MNNSVWQKTAVMGTALYELGFLPKTCLGFIVTLAHSFNPD
jgi:hypothetical protein